MFGRITHSKGRLGRASRRRQLTQGERKLPVEAASPVINSVNGEEGK